MCLKLAPPTQTPGDAWGKLRGAQKAALGVPSARPLITSFWAHARRDTETIRGHLLSFNTRFMVPKIYTGRGQSSAFQKIQQSGSNSNR